jgi:hypothetical protein
MTEHRPNFIKPVEDAATEPLTAVDPIAEHYGATALLRAVDAGLEVYDSGRILMVSRSEFHILHDLSKPLEAGR